jgi:hypothetical protein
MKLRGPRYFKLRGGAFCTYGTLFPLWRIFQVVDWVVDHAAHLAADRFGKPCPCGICKVWLGERYITKV